ncbi:MAG: SPFH domain-containing protein [Pseudomonadota bacterium]
MPREGTHETVTGHIRFSGTLVPAFLSIGAVVLAAVALYTRQHAGLVLASWMALVVLVFFEVRLRLTTRAAKIAPARSEPMSLPRLFGSSIVIWLLVTASLGLGYRAPANPPDSMGSLAVAAVALLITMFATALAHYYQHASSAVLTERQALACWSRATLWVGLTVAALSLLDSFTDFHTDRHIVQSIMLLSVLPALEWLLRMLAREDGHASLVIDVRVIRVMFSRLNPVVSALDSMEQRCAVDLRSTWALTVVRQSLIPLSLGLALLGWLTTSVVTINTFQAGIQERFGNPVSRQALQPGIHIKAPWPIDHIHRIEVDRVRSMTLGFAGPTIGASLLWTKQHAAEEYHLLLGDGRDLVTVNALLHYVITDPWQWHYGTQNPTSMLRIAAEQALLRNTVSRSLSDVLSEHTALLVEDIEADINALICEYEIGVEIVGVTLQGLHPPVQVAEDYQAVVSAQHESEIAVLASRSYEIETMNNAQSEMIGTTVRAETEYWFRTQTARGSADAFSALQSAHAQAPEPIELHLRLRAIVDALEYHPLLVIDDRIEKDGGVLWFED